MFGKQHRRTGRNTARRLAGWPNLHRSIIPNRSAWGRLAIGAVAALVTVVVIDYGGVPFTYRVGQTVARDIRSKVSFSIPNETRTARKRDQAAESVAPIYRNDPQPFEPLITGVEALLEAMSTADSLDQLPTALTAEWGLTPETFTLFKAAVQSPRDTDSLARSIQAILRSVQARGILDIPGADQRTELKAGTRIQVQSPGAELIALEITDVLRVSLLDNNGAVAQSITTYFGTKESGDRFFELLKPRLEKLPATLTLDAVSTETARQAARDAVQEERDAFEVGDRLVALDQPITVEQILLLKAEHETWAEGSSGAAARLRRTPSIAALVLGLAALASYYIGRFECRLALSTTRIALLSLLIVATVALSKRLRIDLPHGETIVVALSAMAIAISYSQQFALLITFGLGLICAWMFGTGVNDFVVLTGGAAAAVLALNRVRSRTKLISVGAVAAVTFFLLTWATGLLAAQTPEMLLWDGAVRGLWGVMAGFLMGGSLPFLERLFGIVTDINLLELSDVSHPLLLELMRKAPGTYNHSVAVATLAETAAEQIDANPLLCRVGSYFHDVGKMLKPQYFVENQTDSINRHDTLNPAMSTLIIIGHVKDGADLGHEHSLPQPIIDLIEQHHGTTLVEYFFKEATRDSQGDSEKMAEVDEAAFRYPGPKPQTKEACILMLADAVESASRTLSEPTPGRIEGLVHELTLKRLLDGQFDECGVTLQDIALIKESLIKSLNAIYHGRVKYPEQRTA